MLTNEDIVKLIKAHKEIFATREEIDGRFDEIRQVFSNLIDNYLNLDQDNNICLAKKL